MATVAGYRVRLIYFFLGAALVSGALQRPIGGQVLDGSMTQGIEMDSNSMMTVFGAIFYGWSAFWYVKLLPRSAPSREMYPLIAIVLLAFLSLIWSSDPGHTFVKVLGLVGCTLFALVVRVLFDFEELVDLTAKFFSILLITTFLILMIFPAYALHGSDEVYSMHAGLLRGTYHHKNSFGSVLSLALVVIFFQSTKGVYGKSIRYIAILIGFYMLTLSGSAKTFVAVPVAMAFGCILYWLRGFNIRIFATVVFVVFYVLLEYVGVVEYVQMAVLDGLDRDVNMSARTFIWAIAIDEGMKTSMLGSGFGGAGWKGDGIGATMLDILQFDPGHSHNGFIQTFVELGFVGLFVVLFYLIYSALSILRMKSSIAGRYFQVFSAWFVVFIVNNYAGSFMIQANHIYWYMLFLSACFLGYYKEICAERYSGFAEIRARGQGQ